MLQSANQLSDEIKECNRKLKEYQKAETALRTGLVKPATEIETLKAQIEHYGEQLKNQEVKLTEKEKKIEELKTELGQLTTENNLEQHARKRVDKLKSELTNLQKSVEDLNIEK